MIENINTATNAELEEEMSQLYQKFENVKAEIFNKYMTLQNLSAKYEEIKKIMDKRKGKIDG